MVRKLLRLLARVPYFCGRTWRHLRESPLTNLLTIATIGMVMFLFAGFLVVEENLRHIARGWAEEGMHLSLFLHADFPPEKIGQLTDRIASYPEVKEVTYTSPVQAWLGLRDALGARAGVLEGIDPSILPPTVEVSLRSERVTPVGVKGIARRLERLGGVEEVRYGQEWMDRLMFFLNVVRAVGWGAGSVLFVSALFIVVNTIKLAVYARREEVEVLKLVGGSDAFVRLPFVLEGMAQGGLGAALALAGVAGLYHLISGRLAEASFLATSPHLTFFSSRGVAALLLWGVALGTVGSWWAVSSFLRRKG